MTSMKLSIKNMVCNRCVIVVRRALDDLGFSFKHVALGEVDFGENIISNDQIKRLETALGPLGFELINDKKSKLDESDHDSEKNLKCKTAYFTLLFA